MNNFLITGKKKSRNSSYFSLLLLTTVALSGCSSMPSWLGGESKEKPKLAGERIPVLPVDTSLKPDPALAAKQIVVPAVNKNSSWPTHSGMFNSDASNLGGGSFDHQSSATAGDGNEYKSTLVISPVVGGPNSDPMVFAMDAIGKISAHSTANISKIRWQNNGVSQEDKIPIQGGGLTYDNGRLYAASGRGVVVAMDAATGKEIWHKVLHVPFRSAPRVAGDKIFLTTVDNQMFALGSSDGEVSWNQRGISESTGLMNTVTPVVSDDKVVAPYSSGEVYVLSTGDGKEIWSDTLSGGKRSQASALFAGIGGDPVIDGNVVLVVSSGGTLAIRALVTGQPAWSIPVGSNNTPWIAGEYIYVLSSDNTLLALHKYDGHIHWSTKLVSFTDPKTKKDPITWKGPVMIEGKLAVVGSNGQMLLVNATDGVITTTKTIPTDIYTSPVVAAGRMFLEGQDAKLYSLE